MTENIRCGISYQFRDIYPLCSATGLLSELGVVMETSDELEQKQTLYTGRTSLHQAASHGHTEVVEILIAKGAGINYRDDIGRNPLHHASSHGHTEVVEVLIAKGADLNYGDINGQTPLHDAALNGHTQLVELLIARKADLRYRDNNVSTNYIRS